MTRRRYEERISQIAFHFYHHLNNFTTRVSIFVRSFCWVLRKKFEYVSLICFNDRCFLSHLCVCVCVRSRWISMNDTNVPRDKDFCIARASKRHRKWNETNRNDNDEICAFAINPLATVSYQFRIRLASAKETQKKRIARNNEAKVIDMRKKEHRQQQRRRQQRKRIILCLQ